MDNILERVQCAYSNYFIISLTQPLFTIPLNFIDLESVALQDKLKNEWIHHWIYTVSLDQIPLNIFHNLTAPSIGGKFDNVVRIYLLDLD